MSLPVRFSAPGRGNVQVLLPALGRADMSQVLARLNDAPLVSPFDPSRVDFVADVARELGRRCRGLPETQALAYWMRKAELSRLAKTFAALGTDSLFLMPRGTVFHIPPSNVDTLFVYPWVLSTLVGNRNVVRLSSRSTEQANRIIEVIDAVLKNHPAVADASWMVTYGHDDAVTAEISAACDVRVIWGGNTTINRIRAIPISAHATELVFADRFSIAAIGLAEYEKLAESERGRLAELFFNDAYWFDQLGCSSARLLIWIGAGDPAESAADFYSRVRDVAVAKGYMVDTSGAIAKMTYAYRAMIDANVRGYDVMGNTLTVLDMASFPDMRGEFCGAGLFMNLHAKDISEIAPHVRREDQTLTAFGIDAADLRGLVSRLSGRGLDRIVPFGQALQFDRIWDGYDLLQELTRKTTLVMRDVLR